MQQMFRSAPAAFSEPRLFGRGREDVTYSGIEHDFAEAGRPLLPGTGHPHTTHTRLFLAFAVPPYLCIASGGLAFRLLAARPARPAGKLTEDGSVGCA